MAVVVPGQLDDPYSNACFSFAGRDCGKSGLHFDKDGCPDAKKIEWRQVVSVAAMPRKHASLQNPGIPIAHGGLAIPIGPRQSAGNRKKRLLMFVQTEKAAFGHEATHTELISIFLFLLHACGIPDGFLPFSYSTVDI